MFPESSTSGSLSNGAVRPERQTAMNVDSYSFSRAIPNMAERENPADALFTESERAQVTLDSIGDAVLSIDHQGQDSYAQSPKGIFWRISLAENHLWA